MRSVQFTFAPHVEAQHQAQRLEEISGWPEVVKVGQVDAASPADAVRRMAYAYVRDDADPAAVAQRLRAVQGIESASEPTPRGLA